MSATASSEVGSDLGYSVIDSRLRRFSLVSFVWGFVDYKKEADGISYRSARTKLANMTEEDFEAEVARYKLETSE